jgi:hypothetical protein
MSPSHRRKYGYLRWPTEVVRVVAWRKWSRVIPVNVLRRPTVGKP